LAHSRNADIVPFTLGEGLHQTIKHIGLDVTWKKYEYGGHWIHPSHIINDMSTFLRRIMDILLTGRVQVLPAWKIELQLSMAWEE
jgi:hypothetical protein